MENEFSKSARRHLLPRILYHQGLRVNHNGGLRLRQQKDLLPRPRRKWTKTAQRDHPYLVFPNLIRNLLTTSIDQVWFEDITYIGILTGFVYLAVILGTCTF